MAVTTFIGFALLIVAFWLVVDIINAIYIGGRPMLFPTNMIVKLIELPFLPIKIIRKVVKVFFFPFKTIIHTFLKL